MDRLGEAEWKSLETIALLGVKEESLDSCAKGGDATTVAGD
tara:strand:- start:152 stop:274 length:123 start_codon:yes stop_codon:yes gene_type:complete